MGDKFRYWRPRFNSILGHGICGIEFDRKDIEMNKLVVTLLGGTFKVYDMRTQHPQSAFANLTQEVIRS